MPKKPAPGEATEAFGSDSFLDIVANMVGILIILIMVAGLRAHDAAIDAVERESEPPKVDEIAPLRMAADKLKGDVEFVFRQARELDELAARNAEERNALALIAAAKKADLEEKKAELATGEVESLDLRQAAERERIRLVGLERDLAAVVEQPPESVKIKTYPTPISRTVYGREAHFQIKDNRIAYVPLNELVDLVKREVPKKIHRARDLDHMVETVGPIGDFRLKYVIQRMSQNGEPSSSGQIIGVTQIVFLPLTSQIGETLDEAMRPQSDFARELADLDPRRVTITFWTYPESFAMYRTLREKLYQAGYSVAGRPLRTGQPISGSPNGSNSSAQ